MLRTYKRERISNCFLGIPCIFWKTVFVSMPSLKRIRTKRFIHKASFCPIVKGKPYGVYHKSKCPSASIVLRVVSFWKWPDTVGNNKIHCRKLIEKYAKSISDTFQNKPKIFKSTSTQSLQAWNESSNNDPSKLWKKEKRCSLWEDRHLDGSSCQSSIGRGY